MSTGTPRWKWLVAGYVLLALTGVAAILWPSPAVVNAGGRAWASAWAVLLIVGGTSCAYGAARQLYRWEYAGLGPLVAVWLVYSVAAFAVVATGRLDRVVGGLGLLAVACLLAHRWQEVALSRRAARQLAERD